MFFVWGEGEGILTYEVEDWKSLESFVGGPIVNREDDKRAGTVDNTQMFRDGFFHNGK